MKHCPQLKKCLKNPTVLLKNTNKLSNYSKSEIIMKLNFTKREREKKLCKLFFCKQFNLYISFERVFNFEMKKKHLGHSVKPLEISLT